MPKPALALAVLALQQVAGPLFPTKDLPRTRNLEALGNGFPCLCFSRDSWHGTGKLGTPTPLASQKWKFFLALECVQDRFTALEDGFPFSETSILFAPRWNPDEAGKFGALPGNRRCPANP